MIGAVAAARVSFITSDVMWVLRRKRPQTTRSQQLPFDDVDDAATLDRLCAELFSSNGFSEPSYAPYEAPFTREYLATLLKESNGQLIWHGSEPQI